MYEIIINSIPDEIIYLAKAIKEAGYRFYVVGGFVRDIFLGSCDTHENDIDVCGDCPPAIFAEIIGKDAKINLCNSNFPLGTLKLIIGNVDIEYTCFRTESYRGDGYHTPSQVVFTTDIFQDAKRRDFSINALYLDPLTCKIVDFFSGQNDITNKIIKTVRESVDVFSEDALRLVRMCRFSAKLGFNIHSDTMKGAKKCAWLLNNISKERIGIELDKILTSATYINFGIDALYTSGINKIICPCISMEAAKKTCIVQSDKYLRWAIFLSENSAEYSKKYILNLSLGKELANEVYRLIRNKNIGESHQDEVIVYFAKIGNTAAKRQIDFINITSSKNSENLLDIYMHMQKNNQFISYDMLSIDGNEIMNIFSVKGKAIKYLKNEAYKYAVLNPEKNNLTDLKHYLLSIHYNKNFT